MLAVGATEGESAGTGAGTGTGASAAGAGTERAGAGAGAGADADGAGTERERAGTGTATAGAESAGAPTSAAWAGGMLNRAALSSTAMRASWGPQTRGDAQEQGKDLTRGMAASATERATASTIRPPRGPEIERSLAWRKFYGKGSLRALMTTTQHPDRVVLHIAGNDRPGVTARLAEVIAEDESAQLINIGQSVLHGYLMLSAIVDIPRNSYALRKLLFAATDMGLRFEVTPFRSESEHEARSDVNSLSITVLGPLRNGVATAAITSFMAKRAMNIREIRSLSDHELDGLELIVDLPAGTALSATELSELRGHLLRLGMELGVDLAVQRDDMFRRSKRLVCMDVDSTFVKGEFIDELAELAGCKEQVAGITARAMRGEIDFKQALAERVQLLEGLPFERARSLIERFELTPGADRFVKILHSLGFRVGLVSGGFTFFVDELKARFGLDFAFANELEVIDGKLSGKVRGTIVDSERKAQILKDMAQVYTCRLEQTVAIGDGANDIFMLQTAGLGIAFRAKPKLQEVADMSLNHNERLDTLLYLMGFNSRDLRLA